MPRNTADCTSKDIPWDSLSPSVFLLNLQNCSAVVARKWLKVLNASGVIWYKKKRNSSLNREGGLDCSLFVLQDASWYYRELSSTQLWHSHYAPPREDFDMPLGAGELGRCGGVEILIFSGDCQTRNRSK